MLKDQTGWLYALPAVLSLWPLMMMYLSRNFCSQREDTRFYRKSQLFDHLPSKCIYPQLTWDNFLLRSRKEGSHRHSRSTHYSLTLTLLHSMSSARFLSKTIKIPPSWDDSIILLLLKQKNDKASLSRHSGNALSSCFLGFYDSYLRNDAMKQKNAKPGLLWVSQKKM